MIMETKKCSSCGEGKLIIEFPKRSRSKDGLREDCIMCSRKSGRDHRRTKNGVVTVMFSTQKISSIKRNHPKPSYSKQELKDWLFSQKVFHELYDNWVISGYDTYKKPSCDRKDDYKPYTLSNLRVVTWKVNVDKYHEDQKNGINNKNNKAVVGIHKRTGVKMEFHSISEAGRHFGARSVSISHCLNGRSKSAHGYKWEFCEN
jgi:hypothetical protein